MRIASGISLLIWNHESGMIYLLFWRDGSRSATVGAKLCPWKTWPTVKKQQKLIQAQGCKLCCVQWALYHRMKVFPPCYGSWVSLPKFLVFLAKLREVNLAEKPNSKLWIWMLWASMSPSLWSLYIALSPSEKGHSVKFIFQFKVHDLGWRAPGFWFHFPTASHLQFSLCIDLTSSGHASSPFPVCPGGYACSENRPRTHLWCWGQAGQPALPPWG